MDDRGAVIGLLKREVEDLKAALSDAETRRGVWMDEGAPVIDPHLEIELEKVPTTPRSIRVFRLYFSLTTVKLGVYTVLPVT